MVIADEGVRMPGQLRRKSARADGGRQSEMDWRIGNHHQLAAGERRPHEREDHHGEARGHARSGPNGARRAPRQDRAQGQRDAPTDESPGEGGNHVHDEVDDQAPEGEAHDQPLGEGHAVVALPQHHPDDDVAHGSQRDELRREEQQAGDDRRIHDHARRHRVVSGIGESPGEPSGALHCKPGGSTATRPFETPA